MITGSLLMTMGALWYVLRASVPLSPGRMLAAYALTMAGVLAALVATLLGGFAASWTFLAPLPFYPAGQWSVWSESVFFAGVLLVGAGFCVYCLDVLERTTNVYGGLTRTLGLHFLRGREAAGAAAAGDRRHRHRHRRAHLLRRRNDDPRRAARENLRQRRRLRRPGREEPRLLLRPLDREPDDLPCRAAIYVLVPRYAGRPYETTKVFVAGWMGSLVFIATAYSHHLYMDFVQPSWAAIISAIASYGALIPVAVITIYSMTMLIWGSRYQWTLASTLLFVGFAGWAIGGVGAVIDSIIPINFRLHNTTWVVAHFHTYMVLTVVVWGLALLAHLLERAAGRTSRAPPALDGRAAPGRRLRADRHLVRRGCARSPAPLRNPASRDKQLQPGRRLLRAAAGARLPRLHRPTRPARTHRRKRRREHFPSRHPSAHRRLLDCSAAGEAEPRVRGKTRVDRPSRSAALDSAQLGLGAAACVVALAAFLPQVVEASEVSNRFHHLDHAGQFFAGAMFGLLLGSLPVVSRRLGDRSSLGLAAVLVAPTADDAADGASHLRATRHHPLEHASYHLAMAAFGLITGLGATRLGLVTGRLMFALSIGMALMFAAAMT